MATTSKRKPGRRAAPADGVVAKHDKKIDATLAEIAELESAVDSAKNQLAKQLDAGCQAGVPTEYYAEKLGKSRQMIYKMIRERVDRIPLNKGNGAANPFAKKNKPAAKKSASKKAAPKLRKKAATK